jgi:hypothetical protein
VSIERIRAAFAHCAFTGISRNHLGQLLTELRPAWTVAREGRLYARRGRDRLRRAGAGRRQRLSFTDRVVLTLVHLRIGIPHDALAVVFGVDRATVTRAIGQVRPLLANRGFAAPTGVRLRTLADVFAYAAAEGVTLRLDATEIRVRRPRAGRPGRKAFVSGKLKQNTIKTTVVADAHGATLWCGSTRPGRMHDLTAARTEGIDVLLQTYPQVHILVDTGYQGLARDLMGATSRIGCVSVVRRVRGGVWLGSCRAGSDGSAGGVSGAGGRCGVRGWMSGAVCLC